MDADGPPPDDAALRRDLARLVHRLLEEPLSAGPTLSPRIRAHVGVPQGEPPIMGESLEAWELPNLQLALTATLERPGWSGEVLGVAGEGKRYSMLSLADLLTGAWQLGAPEYVNAEIGPGRTLPCLDFGLVLVTAPDGPFCLFVRRGEMMGHSSLVVQALAADEGRAQAALADLRALMRAHDVFRGQLITIEAGAHGGRRLVFLERPEMAREDLVLPAGMLERSSSTCSARPATATRCWRRAAT